MKAPAPAYTVLSPRTFDSETLFRDQFALDVLMGLSEERKRLPSKYFYDAAGSRLFEEICDLPEYYPTQCEAEVLERHKGEIAARAGAEPLRLVELGAGDGRKTKTLLAEFLRRRMRFKYVPIDISEDSVRGLTGSLAESFPGLAASGIVAEYFDALRWLNNNDAGRKLVLFLGSNIGNFNGPQSRVFLRTLWNALGHGDLVLIGFDLKKDFDVLLRAYNDPRGVTARFNLNLLERINRELGADFALGRFRHFGTYDVFEGAMKSYLVSVEAQHVNVLALNKRFEFRPYEPIHMEFSYKYLPDETDSMAHETGFRILERYFDSKRWFLDALWEVEKPRP